MNRRYWTAILFACLINTYNGLSEKNVLPPRHQGLSAVEWRDVFLGKKNFKGNYFTVFEKVDLFSDDTLAVFADLLNDDMLSNRVVYVLNTIAAKCDKRASRLGPCIRKHLHSKNICQQLAALCAIRSVGDDDSTTISDVSACLKSKNAVIRVNAACTLSTFGSRSKNYLPAIRILYKNETNDSFRIMYRKIITKLEQ